MSDSAAERDGITVREDAALVVVDVHAGFDDPWWGSRDNPEADHNIAALVEAFASSGRPMVFVGHDSANPDSPLHPERPGNQLKSYLTQTPPHLRLHGEFATVTTTARVLAGCAR